MINNQIKKLFKFSSETLNLLISYLGLFTFTYIVNLYTLHYVKFSFAILLIHTETLFCSILSKLA